MIIDDKHKDMIVAALEEKLEGDTFMGGPTAGEIAAIRDAIAALSAPAPEQGELLPCPFCGGKVEPHFAEGVGWELFCHACDKVHVGYFHSEREAIEFWNKRTPPAPEQRVDRPDGLLPCPICGGESVIVFYDKEGEKNWSWYAMCNDLDCGLTHRRFKYRSQAIDAWNKRTPPVPAVPARAGGDS